MKLLKKQFVLIVALLLGAMSQISAQNAQAVKPYNLKGVVIDSISGEPEAYATVRVFSPETREKVLKAAATNEEGKFEINMGKPGMYVILVSSVGKAPIFKMAMLSSQKNEFDFGVMKSKESKTTLAALEVIAQKPLITADIDKIAYNVEEDPDSKVNTVSEMLRKVPMVTVDGEGNVQVNGKSNFKVYVNGKPNTMMSNNPKEIFRSMPASTIKSVEVITDPGAKYDAEGVGGILNIVTAGGSKMDGFNITLNARGGNTGAGGGVFATVQSGKFTLSLNGNYNYEKQKQGTESVLEDFLNETNHKLSRIGKKTDRNNVGFGGIEASYEIDSLNLITLSGQMFAGKVKSEGLTLNEMTSKAGSRVYAYNALDNANNSFGNIELKLDYQRSFKKPGKYLTLSYALQLSPNGEKSDATYSDLEDVKFDLYNRYYDVKTRTNEHTLQLDFVNPITDKHYIDFGGKYIYRRNSSDNIMTYTELDGSLLPSMEEVVKYSQLRNIIALYGDYQLKVGKFGFKAGARYEHSLMNAEYELTPDRNFKANFDDVVPTVNLSYLLSPTKNIRATYNMRINRPNIESLNPFVKVISPNEISYGNPDLNTEKTHNINVTFGSFAQKFSINLTGSYSFTNNGISSYSTMKDGVLVTTFGNITKRKDAGISAWLSWSPVVATRISLNLRGSYVKYDSEMLSRHSDGFTGNVFANVQQMLPWGLTLSLFGGYNAPSVNLQGRGWAIHFYGMNLSKSFLKEKRLTVSLFGIGFFEKNIKVKTTIESDTFRQTSLIEAPLRRFGVQISYRFGKMGTSVKKTKRSISNDDTQAKEQPSTNITSVGGM